MVCAVLYALAYKPILRLLEARRQQIATGLANAEEDQDRARRDRRRTADVLLKAEAQASS